MTRDVVPQLSEPRGLLRRRKTDGSCLHSEARATATAVPVVAAAEVAPPAEPPPVTHEPDADERFRAQTALLQAALWEVETLAAALSHEQQLRRRDTERLVTENGLLRDALAALHADALRRQSAETPTCVAAIPEQRLEGEARQRSGRRRSRREAGPA